MHKQNTATHQVCPPCGILWQTVAPHECFNGSRICDHEIDRMSQVLSNANESGTSRQIGAVAEMWAFLDGNYRDRPSAVAQLAERGFKYGSVQVQVSRWRAWIDGNGDRPKTARIEPGMAEAVRERVLDGCSSVAHKERGL